MVEQRVQPLKLRAHLLCDYIRVGDLTREIGDVLEADELTKHIARLVTPATIIAAEKAMEAFSATYQLDLVSLLFLSYLPFLRGA